MKTPPQISPSEFTPRICRQLSLISRSISFGWFTSFAWLTSFGWLALLPALQSCVSAPKGFAQTSQNGALRLQQALQLRFEKCLLKKDDAFLGILEVRDPSSVETGIEPISTEATVATSKVVSFQLEGGWDTGHSLFRAQAQSPLGQAIVDLEVTNLTSKAIWQTNPYVNKPDPLRPSSEKSEVEKAIDFVTSLKPGELHGFLCGSLLAMLQEAEYFESENLQTGELLSPFESPQFMSKGKISVQGALLTAKSEFYFSEGEKHSFKPDRKRAFSVEEVVGLASALSIRTRIESPLPFASELLLTWTGENASHNQDLPRSHENIIKSDIYSINLPKSFEWQFNKTRGKLTILEFD